METNQTIHGDCLKVLKSLPEASIDLVYADPPFAKGRHFGAYSDQWKNLDHYLDWMKPRLQAIHQVLKPTGSLYLHCDFSAGHYLKVLTDSIFGRNQFINEIVWLSSTGSAKGNQHPARTYGRYYDTILLYAKTKQYTFNGCLRPLSEEEMLERFPYQDQRGRFNTNTPLFCTPSMGNQPSLCYEYKGWYPPHPSGWRLSKKRLQQLDQAGEIWWREGRKPVRKAYADSYKGQPIGNLWTDINNLKGDNERIGYPTQKPLALLTRIITVSSNPDDLVLDPFCGSGTTLVACQTLGRNWIGIDQNPQAISITNQRLQQTGSDPNLTLFTDTGT